MYLVGVTFFEQKQIGIDCDSSAMCFITMECRLLINILLVQVDFQDETTI